MRYFILIIAFLSLSQEPVQAQKGPDSSAKKTYPIDSCLYFMDPLNLRVNRIQDLGGPSTAFRTSFRSTSEAGLEYFITGQSLWIGNDTIFVQLPDLVIDVGTTIQGLFSLPDEVHDPDGPWSEGGTVPYPVVLNGFIQQIDNEIMDPPIPVAMQAIRFQIIPLE